MENRRPLLNVHPIVLCNLKKYTSISLPTQQEKPRSKGIYVRAIHTLRRQKSYFTPPSVAFSRPQPTCAHTCKNKFLCLFTQFLYLQSTIRHLFTVEHHWKL